MPLIIDTFKEQGINYEIFDGSTFAITLFDIFAFHFNISFSNSTFWFQFPNYSIDFNFCTKERFAELLCPEWTKWAWGGGFKFLTNQEQIKAFRDKHYKIKKLTKEEKNALRFILEGSEWD